MRSKKTRRRSELDLLSSLVVHCLSFASITVSSINDLNSYNIERIISIKGEYEQQIRALETIYAKLCQAFESDNARLWSYSSQYYQQQQLMQHFAQQAAMMAAATGGTAQPLLPTHYSQAPQQSVIHQSQTNNSNGSSNKFLEQQQQAAQATPQQQQQQQQSNANAIYHPSYYVS